MPVACQHCATVCRRGIYPCNTPSLGVALVAMVVVVVLGKHGPGGHLGGVELAAAKDARRRIHHGRARGIEAIWGGVHGGQWCGRDNGRVWSWS
jgi:hypothetical protein